MNLETDFKEIETKRKGTIVLVNFEDFLIDYYHVKNMQEVEPHANSNNEYMCVCPYCKSKHDKEGIRNYSKEKLYIRADLTVGHCFVCGRTFINISNDLKFEVDQPKGLMNFGFIEPFKIVSLEEDSEYGLGRYLYDADDIQDSQEGIKYLENRHSYLPEIAKALDFRYLPGCVLMPFRFMNFNRDGSQDGKGDIQKQAFYYQIRFTDPKSKIRYFFPPISKKPPFVITKTNETRKRVIICEGIYDAIALMILTAGKDKDGNDLSYIPFACMGSSISQYEMTFLKQLNPKEIVIFMDEAEISKRILNTIQPELDMCQDYKIFASPIHGEDPEEYMKRIQKEKPGKELGYLLKQLNYERKKHSISSSRW